jgi:flavin reductase (DIM6/NTAB) family NADH-FMN oxidoreductase RutF
VPDLPRLLERITHGVYVVGVAHGDRRDAFTAAWITQLSFDPPLVALSINPGNVSYELARASGAFVVNVLGRDHLELARSFGTRSARDADKLAGVTWHPARSGGPILDEAIAYLECEVASWVRAGDHELAIARVTGGEVIDASATPMLYSDTGDMDGSSALYRSSSE